MKSKDIFKRANAGKLVRRRAASIEPLSKVESLKIKAKTTPQFYIGLLVFTITVLFVIIAFTTSNFNQFGVAKIEGAENLVGVDGQGLDYWSIIMISTINTIAFIASTLGVAIVASFIIGWLAHLTNKFHKTHSFFSNISHLVLMPAFILISYSFFQGSFFSSLIPIAISITIRLSFLISNRLVEEKNKEYLKSTFNGIISRKDVLIKSLFSNMIKTTLLTVLSSTGFIIVWLSFFTLINLGVSDPEVLFGKGITLTGILREILSSVNNISVGASYLCLTLFVLMSISLVSVQEGLEKIFPKILVRDQLW